MTQHRSRTEGPPQHFSVIQSTGLAANSKPLALLTQTRRELSPTSSPIALTTSPKALSSTASPKLPKLLPSSSPQHLPLSLCSSPKPLSVPSPPRSTLPPSTSPNPFGLTSSVTSSQKPSVKPSQHTTAGPGKPNKRKQLEASLAQINEFRLKQVIYHMMLFLKHPLLHRMPKIQNLPYVGVVFFSHKAIYCRYLRQDVLYASERTYILFNWI